MLDESAPIVRSARREEIAEIAELTAAALEGFRGMVPGKPLDRYIEHSCDVAGRWDSGDVVIAKDRGRIVGTVTYADQNADAIFPAGWATVRTLMVHPEARGRGLGRLLVGHCIEAARRNGTAILALHTADFMAAACHIYRRAGFYRCPEHDLMASIMLGFDPAEGEVLVTAYRLDL